MAALHCTKERKKKQSHFFSNHKERAVVRSENQEGHLVLDEYNMPSHLVEIGLTYLPKTGGGGGWGACDSPGFRVRDSSLLQLQAILLRNSFFQCLDLMLI